MALMQQLFVFLKVMFENREIFGGWTWIHLILFNLEVRDIYAFITGTIELRLRNIDMLLWGELILSISRLINGIALQVH